MLLLFSSHSLFLLPPINLNLILVHLLNTFGLPLNRLALNRVTLPDTLSLTLPSLLWLNSL